MTWGEFIRSLHAWSYMAEMGLDQLTGEFTSDVQEAMRRNFGDEDDDPATQALAAAPIAEAVPAVATELPPAKSRPYWLA
ncbi:MAG TPA: hypothetical protein VH682_29620 [Gemmataceae bacterium]|jgi:hypothetical protein